MAFLLLPLFSMLWIVSVAVDAFAILVIVRIAAIRWSPSWLRTIDAVGKPAVDSWLAWVSRWYRGPGQLRVSSTAVLLLTLLGLWVLSSVLGSAAWTGHFEVSE